MKKLFFSALLLQTIYLPNSHALMRALNTAATGMATQDIEVSTISNNIANANTIGYKRQRAESEDLSYQTLTEAGSRSSFDSQYSVGLQIGSGSKISAVKKDFSQGSANITNNPFDLMINGEGFFGVIMPTGETYYTRNGSFNVDQSGILVDGKGYRIFPGINFPPGTKSVNISTSGNVEAYLNGQIEPSEIGQIPVFTFVNPVGLSSAGGNLFRQTSSSGIPIQGIPGQANTGNIQQGALESSNVSIMTEMTGLIKAQRTFEMNSKVINVADQMLQTTNNIR